MSKNIITIKVSGDFKNSNKFFKRMLNGDHLQGLEKYGRMGVEALASATPVDSGLTANSWNYFIDNKDGNVSITWTNSNVQNGVNIALILNNGHGTRGGYWVEGRDYINPALSPIFDEIAEGAWKEVTA